MVNLIHRLNHLNKFNLSNIANKLNRINHLQRSNHLRGYHFLQNKRCNKKLLSIKNANLESSRQLNSLADTILVSTGLIILLVAILRKFGPSQVWYFDKIIDIKFKIFNFFSNEKFEIVDEKYLEDTKNSKFDQMGEKEYAKNFVVKKPKDKQT